MLALIVAQQIVVRMHVSVYASSVQGLRDAENPEDASVGSYHLPVGFGAVLWQIISDRFGYNDVIDDLACLLDDEIVGVPNGRSPGVFPACPLIRFRDIFTLF